MRVLDIETTGFDPAKDEVCEIACLDLVNVQGEWRAGDPKATLVNPCRPIPPESSAVHHILDEDVATAPVLAEVIGRYASAKVYIAHNAPFEKSFLGKHFGEKTWLCTYRIAKRLWPEAPGHSNQVLRYMFGIKDPFGIARKAIEPHRALSDCFVTGEVFVRELEEMLTRFGDKAVVFNLMQQWSSAPPMEYVCRFGNKHKGRRYDAIAADDPTYLEWIRDKSEMDADTKWVADHWLRARETRQPPAPAPQPQQQLI